MHFMETRVPWPSVRQLQPTQYSQTGRQMSRVSAQPDASASSRPAALTAHGTAARCQPTVRRAPCAAHHGSTCRPAADASANEAIASEPPQAVFASAATTRADCSSPQGKKTQARPDAAAGKGPETRCRLDTAPETAWGCRTVTMRRLDTSVIHAGCRPVHVIQIPNTSAAACTSAHAGWSTGNAVPRPTTAPTPVAASPPAVA